MACVLQIPLKEKWWKIQRQDMFFHSSVFGLPSYLSPLHFRANDCTKHESFEVFKKLQKCDCIDEKQ